MHKSLIIFSTLILLSMSAWSHKETVIKCSKPSLCTDFNIFNKQNSLGCAKPDSNCSLIYCRSNCVGPTDDQLEGHLQFVNAQNKKIRKLDAMDRKNNKNNNGKAIDEIQKDPIFIKYDDVLNSCAGICLHKDIVKRFTMDERKSALFEKVLDFDPKKAAHIQETIYTRAGLKDIVTKSTIDTLEYDGSMKDESVINLDHGSSDAAKDYQSPQKISKKFYERSLLNKTYKNRATQCAIYQYIQHNEGYENVCSYVTQAKNTLDPEKNIVKMACQKGSEACETLKKSRLGMSSCNRHCHRFSCRNPQVYGECKILRDYKVCPQNSVENCLNQNPDNDQPFVDSIEGLETTLKSIKSEADTIGIAMAG